MHKVLLSLFLFTSFIAKGQQKYFVLFNDKADSQYSVDRPNEFLSDRAISRRQKEQVAITQDDLPVNTSYLTGLEQNGAKILFVSKWFNGAVIEINKANLNQILSLDFVKGLEGEYSNGLEGPNARKGRKGTKDIELFSNFDAGTAANQLEMLGADIMHEQGYVGQGVLIGVLDSGFPNLPALTAFSHLFEENRILDTYDFVSQEVDVYDDHYHGTHVLSCIAAEISGQIRGTAPGASFLLYTTENVASETRMEEVNWLIAAERADSIGVDILTSSLGYSDFQGQEQDYSYETLDGKTALITKAAEIAASKGILVVASAGNEGNGAWKYVTPPSDGPNVIAVGAVSADQQYVGFSSVGPSFDGRIKPDVSAKGLGTTLASTNNAVGTGNGTSYAAPLVTGLIAGMKSAFPDLTASQIKEILLKSGSQAGQPDNLLGYGVPNFVRANELAMIQSLLNNTEEDILMFPNPLDQEEYLKILIVDTAIGESFDVTLTDTNGREIYKENFKRRLVELPLKQKQIPTGLYLLRIQNENYTEVKRLFIR
ncbi:S8 family serine peptidase [Jiulongibacter sp. NS-SX5]|uniref:S8 family serine peptidase n=1 Tax=Jiulongibacter sp. NS-SX5 TaxID=3463854 RepID=UPI0040596045